MAPQPARGPGRALVVGAGIAGLATARALHRQGIDCDVVERVGDWGREGTGLYLPANSVRALRVLGLHDAVLGRGHEIAQQRFRDAGGRLLLEIDLPGFWEGTGPCVAISRRDLHEVLREGLAVRMATTVVALHEEAGVVRAVLDDRAGNDYTLVVGADGLRSWVRATAGGGEEPRFLGQVSWRFLAEGFPELSAWTVWLGRDRVFLAVPLGEGRTYCYADLDAATPTDPTAGDSASLTALFADFAEPVPSLLAAGVAGGPRPFFAPLEEVVAEPWVSGRVVLVGDAAHAMSPNMAEGAGLALEDALVLAETVASGRPLADFETRRRPRVSFVRAQTRRRDHTRRRHPALRSAALRVAGQRIFRANYGPLRAQP